MRRREFIAGIAGAAAWPVVARAQQNSGLRKVGVLFPGVLGAEREKLLNEGLTRELGSERVVLFLRSAEGRSELLGKLAAELVDDHVDFLPSHREALRLRGTHRKPFRLSHLTSNPTPSRLERCKALICRVVM
jgi:hypothetical protein